jgi:pimeloyl-ACP methyl ester carboxylesterase
VPVNQQEKVMSGTIFMIHGMWGIAGDWDNYLPVFEAEGYRCITPTLPYHDMDPRGEPDPRLGTVSLLDYAEVLEREIRQLAEKPILMGHSMGGLLAQILAARGLAKSLVLLAPASPAGIGAITPSVVRSFWSTQTMWGFWKKPLRQTYAEAVYSMMHLLPENEHKECYSKLVYESGKATFEIGYWFLDPRRASRVDESKVTCPVLVIAGAQDRITPVSVIRRVAKKYKFVATYKEYPNHAHWLQGEPQWQEIAGDIIDWLRQTDATGKEV